MYIPYADSTYYKNCFGGTKIPQDDLESALTKASRHIDVLTYNRIVGRGINALSLYQQDVVRECCCRLADFEYENQDMIECILQSYSINGASMTFGSSWNVKVADGVAIQSDIYSSLSTSGLCNRSLGV